MQRDQQHDTRGSFKSPRSSATVDRANDYISASTAGSTDAANANAMPLRAAAKHPGNFSGVEVAGPTVGGTPAPYDPAKVELAKEHLADSLNSLSTTTAKNESLDEPKTSISETVRSGAASAATGAAAAAVGVISVAKKLIGGRDDDDTDESDYTDALQSPTATTVPASIGPAIKPNADHGLEFNGEKNKKKPMKAGDRASEKVNIVARAPSAKATHGSSPGAREPSGPLPDNISHVMPPRLSALTLGDPFGPVVVTHWNDFKHEHEVSTPSSEDFEREDYERTHPMPTDARSQPGHTESTPSNYTPGGIDNNLAPTNPFSQDIHPAAAATTTAANPIAVSDAAKTHPAYIPSPLKQSTGPSSSAAHDIKLTSYDEPDLSIRRQTNLKDSTPLGGMNVDKPLDTSPQRRTSMSGMNVDDNINAPVNLRAATNRQSGLNVDRSQATSASSRNQRRRRSSGFNVDVPAEATAYGGDGSAATVTQHPRPSGTYNTGMNVDRPGSKGNKTSGLGVDGPARSTYDVKTHQLDGGTPSYGSTTSRHDTEATAAVVGAASAMMAAPPLRDTVHVSSGDATAATTEPTATRGGRSGRTKEAEQTVKGAAETVGEKLHLHSHRTQPSTSGYGVDMVPATASVAAGYPHTEASGLSASSDTPARVSSVSPSPGRTGAVDKSPHEGRSTGFAAKVAAAGAATIAAVKGASNAIKGTSDASKSKTNGGLTTQGVEATPGPLSVLPPSSIGTSGTLLFSPLGTSGTLPSGSTGTSGTLPSSSVGTTGTLPPSSIGTSGTLPSSSIGTTGTLPPSSIGTSGTLPSSSIGTSGTLPSSSIGTTGSLPPSSIGTSGTLPSATVDTASVTPSAGTTGATLKTSGSTVPQQGSTGGLAGKVAGGVAAAGAATAATAAAMKGAAHDPKSKTGTSTDGAYGQETTHTTAKGLGATGGIKPSGAQGAVSTMAAPLPQGGLAKEGIKDSAHDVHAPAGNFTTHSRDATAHDVRAPAGNFTTHSKDTTAVHDAHTSGGNFTTHGKDATAMHGGHTPSGNNYTSHGTGAATATPATVSSTMAGTSRAPLQKRGLLSKIKGLFHKDSKVKDSRAHGSSTAATAAATTAAVVGASTAAHSRAHNTAGGSTGAAVSGGYDSPQLTSSGLPKADLRATHGVPATKLDAHPTTTINNAYHVPTTTHHRDPTGADTGVHYQHQHQHHQGDTTTTATPGMARVGAAGVVGGATLGAANTLGRHAAVTSTPTTATTTTTTTTRDAQLRDGHAVPVSGVTVTSARENGAGHVPAGDEVVWMKTTTTTTTTYDDDYADSNQDGMDEYYGRRSLGGWVLGDQGVDKGKQRT
ncbi:hypothetical protein DFQ27_004511 [Actinomortierella ambigua]|uniref:Uncharacterized protein n=1 Tax=Actinomortierella ambigua TaxID=1343610 RepID=A0A9P6U403_9FUNG|nr:hypothetical protein DFQ27_004511 [Actinomortierella ambigua]